MRYDEGHESDDVEDRRGAGGGSVGGGGSGMGGGGIRLGLGGMIVLGILSLVFKRNLFTALNSGGAALPDQVPQGAPVQPGSNATAGARPANENKQAHFAAFVFDDVQSTWETILPTQNARYRHAKMVLFTDVTTSRCGEADSATGPFYCPADEKVYVDLAFYRELATRFKAPGDFAQAYVIAHEVGHHVQNILGIEARMRRDQRAHPASRNALSVKMELQADCLAGIWAHSTEQRKILDPGDIDQGLAAASAVGDDRLQKQATGRVTPETWTHGSAAQRASWFRKGYSSGVLSDCDTFAAP